MAVLPLLILVFLPSAETSSLKYLNIAVKGINLPEFTLVGLVDGEQIVYYDSSNKTLNPKTEWMKKFKDDNPDDWKRKTLRMQNKHDELKHDLLTVMEHFSHNEGVHTLQKMYGCELNEDGTSRRYSQYGYDGEDYTSLDLGTESWTTVKSKPVISKLTWYVEGDSQAEMRCLENICINELKKVILYARDTLRRKVRPEVSVFHKHFPSPELVCHATGFFPRKVIMSWQKDGEEQHEDVELTETLPNQDGSFQRRIILRVSPKELKDHDYNCVIQHSSLEKDLVLKVPVLDPEGALFHIIVAAVASVALFALIAAGVLIWMKKSGFKLVPENLPPPERWRGDSESSTEDKMLNMDT